MFPREVGLLKRLIEAVDSGSDEALAKTVAPLKGEVGAVSWPIHTNLPTVLDMLADEFAGKHNQIRCAVCDGMIETPAELREKRMHLLARFWTILNIALPKKGLLRKPVFGLAKIA